MCSRSNDARTLHTFHFQQHANTQALIKTTSSDLSSLLIVGKQVQQVDHQRTTTASLGQPAPTNGDCNSDSALAYQTQNGPANRCRRSLQTRRLLILRSLLLGRGLEIIQQQAYGGWMFGFKTYNIRPYGATVFRYVHEGNIEALQQLFQSYQATVFDRSPDGLTLLHVGPLISLT